MEQSLRDRILAAPDLKREAVYVPQWGFNVYVRTLTGAELDAWQASLVNFDGKRPRLQMANQRARLVVKCVVDEAGNRLFKDDEADALGRKSAAAIQVLFDAAQRLNALSDDLVEEMEKNSTSEPTDDSGSGSPAILSAP